MSTSTKKKAKPKAKKAPAKGKARPAPTKTKKAAKAVAAEEKPKKVTPEEKPKKVTPKEKPAETKEVRVKPLASAEPKELGPPPAAVVAARHIDSLRERQARGFSFGELASAGVPLDAAKRKGLALDIRRRSVVGGNVELLKSWLSSPADGPKKQMAAAAVGKKK